MVVIIPRPESSPNEFKELWSFVGAGVNDGLRIFLLGKGHRFVHVMYFNYMLLSDHKYGLHT